MYRLTADHYEIIDEVNVPLAECMEYTDSIKTSDRLQHKIDESSCASSSRNVQLFGRSTDGKPIIDGSD